jgi:hypothetical protein
MTRRTIALLIIGLWIAGMGLLYRRSTWRSPEQSLAEAGMLVSPATYYYRVDQGDSQIGAASSAIDTSSALLIATDYIRAAVPAQRDTFRFVARAESRYSRALAFRDLIMKVEGDLPAFLLRGVLQGEGKTRTLQLTTETPNKHATTQEFDVAGLMFMPTVAPLPLMLGKTRKAGSTLPVGIFDPLSRTVKKVDLKIERDSLFTLTDSASLDSVSGRWVPAHKDTVRGWLVSGNAPIVVAWVDQSGRIISASEPGGISLSRTVFEMAFENWRLDRVAVDSAKKAQAVRARARRK